MAIPILVEALFFFLAFSALPVSVIYWIKSREHWIIPYILIQVVTLVYVCVDILFTGAGRTLAPELPLSLFLEMQTSLRILLLVLVPLFLINLLDLAEKERRMICWGAIAGLSLIGFLLFTPILPTARGAAWTRDFTFRSPVYLWVSAASVGLAVYTVIIAERVRNRLWGQVGITNKLFIVAGPVYVAYLVAFTIYPLFKGTCLLFLGISFTNLCYGIWNLVFLRFLLEYITAKPLAATDSPVVDSFIGSADFTDREGEILRMAISGLSNKEIAFRLSISEGTVKTHLFNAFRKVGIHTRVELMNAVYARPERGG